MSTAAVFGKDFKAARRSRTLWAAAVVLGVIAALVAYVSGGARGAGAQQVREVFRLLSLVLAVLLPIVALVGSYLAVAGERESGGIKFLLSLPNTRRDVFAGKWLSRALIVAGGVGFVYLAAVSVSLTRYGALPVEVVVGTLLVTLVYGGAFVSIAVAMSAAVASRSRAIAGAFASYFVLVVLYIVPFVRISSMVRWVHTTILGASPNPDLYNAVRYTSPFLAYRKATNLVFPADMRQVIFISSLPDDISYASAAANTELPLYLRDEVSLLVLGCWLVVPLVAGYWLFERADLE